MKKFVVANWKMLPATSAEAEGIIEKLDEYARGLASAAQLHLIICPPPAYRAQVAKLLGEGILADAAVLGAQDMEPGLVDQSVRYVIIGHSDRRWKAGDSDEVTNGKLKDALRDGLVPIVCLGERTREGAWQDELAAQTAATFDGLTAGQLGQCHIAYEPVWAISTNPNARPDTPASAVQSMALVREVLADHFNISQNTFLYGGSVAAANVADFLSRSEISGVLVGGASVRAEEFCSILSIVTEL
jgi:triosephosphate isomerase